MPNNSKSNFCDFYNCGFEFNGNWNYYSGYACSFAEVTGTEKISTLRYGRTSTSTFALMQFIFGPILGALSDRYVENQCCC